MLTRTLLCSALLASTAHAGAPDILACGTQEREAVTPTDALMCEWKHGRLDATLAQLYADGWRLVATAFFDHTRQVLYLERPVAP